ncbi:MAG: hypothetical protein HRT73_09235 [Flavobacteriales bacterium]|nr:hypothetical protein [Flavobacteriales bacterium]
MIKIFFTYRLVIFTVICTCLLQVQTTSAQWTLDITGSVKKEETKKRMEGATITVKRNGTVWKTLNSPSNGKFEVNLDPNAVYVIEFSKFGYVTKRMEFSTKNVPPDDAKYGFDFPMEMNLFEEVPDLDVSILNQPIAKVAFNPETGYMDYDAAYTKSIKKELDRLKKELAERQKADAANRKENQKSYDAAIIAADKLFNAEKWVEAKPYYEKALAIFPTEDYPDFQLGDISDKLAGMEAANKKYKAAIVRADKAFAERDWGKATTNYEQASLLKESEQYPKDKIKEIKTIQSSEKKVAKDYNEAIAVADQQMLSRDYDNAKLNYEKALRLKSYEKYPKEKIIEIETILTEKAKKDKDYNDAVAAADVQFKAKDYEVSIESYKKALNFKSEEQYPKNKIDEATRLIAEMKLQKKTYDNFIVEADAAFSKKDYTVAKSNYEKAVNLFAEEQYSKDKLTEIKNLIEAAEKLDADYVNAIKIGDKALASKEYEGAKTAYEKALGFKSEEQYPRDKIIEIASLIAGLAKAKEKEEEYLKLIDSADKLLGDKSYEDAKSKYSDALGVKLGEQYPKDKIIEIDGLIAALAKTEADKKAKDEKYQQLISVADQLLGNKSYEDAKNKYNEALGVKSEEQYPKDKITKIDGLLADIAKAEAEAKAKEEQYQQLIISADKLLGGKNYEDAKNKYNEALGVKSEEQYPKDKLKEIEDTLAEIARKKAEEESAKLAGEEREAKYKGVIAVADNSMVTKDYAKAKLKYNEALGIKSGEQYPTDKLKEIELILAEISKKEAEAAAAKMAEGEKDEKYSEAITLADNAFGFENYKQAKLK